MQAARSQTQPTKIATAHTGPSLQRVQLVSSARPLPATGAEIARYVEQLLTPSEQAVCDMATD